MGEYVIPLLLLVALFVVFGLAHRDRYRSCAGCEDDCDSDTCKSAPTRATRN